MIAFSASRDHVGRPTDCCGSAGKQQTLAMPQSVATADYGFNGGVSFFIEGMTCLSCVKKVETDLLKHPGVSRVYVDFAGRSATIDFDPDMVGPESLKTTIEAVGYTATESKAEAENNTPQLHNSVLSQKVWPYPFVIGIAVALGVVGFYLGLLTLTSDWYNARNQFNDYRWWVLALSLGLGTQATLFTFMRKKIVGRNLKVAKSGLAASGGMSTVSMAACCAHYLVVLIPALGLPFMSAAVAGIAAHQTEIFLLGVLSNLFGLGIMLRLLHKNGILKLERLQVK